jgi:membrane protein implicated in regulation of membrane protease activity
MKKPWLAFLLSFLLVGAGLAYLGKWKLAVINFLAAVAIGVVLAYFSPSSVSTAGLAIAAASGALAMSVAKTMNQKSQLQTSPPQP